MNTVPTESRSTSMPNYIPRNYRKSVLYLAYLYWEGLQYIFAVSSRSPSRRNTLNLQFELYTLHITNTISKIYSEKIFRYLFAFLPSYDNDIKMLKIFQNSNIDVKMRIFCLLLMIRKKTDISIIDLFFNPINLFYF